MRLLQVYVAIAALQAHNGGPFGAVGAPRPLSSPAPWTGAATFPRVSDRSIQGVGGLVANDNKRSKGAKARRRRSGSYDPVRGPRLKGPAASAPPPLPAGAPPAVDADDPALFGEALEDGLRILAALETMESLEPDFCDDLAGEAAVTIIERVASFDELPPPLSPSPAPAKLPPARQPKAREAPVVDADDYAAYHGPVDEAVVEIFEGPAPTPARTSSRRKQGRPKGHRFFKALTGDGDG